MIRSATISKCGSYRMTLTRIWRQDRPLLVVIMFNPSTADGTIDDPTILALIRRADLWGYGGFIVVNLVPLRTPDPRKAIQMLHWHECSAWDLRDALQQNVAVIVEQIGKAAAVLLAFGAIGEDDEEVLQWREHVLEEIAIAAWRESGDIPVYCMGRTRSGAPIHPLARGKHRVPTDAPLLPWKEAA